jgi:tetratricopeptide (TPR) repeat protein
MGCGSSTLERQAAEDEEDDKEWDAWLLDVTGYNAQVNNLTGSIAPNKAAEKQMIDIRSLLPKESRRNVKFRNNPQMSVPVLPTESENSAKKRTVSWSASVGKIHPETPSKNMHPKGVSVDYLRHTFLPEIQEAGVSIETPIEKLENLQDTENLGVIRSKGEKCICPQDSLVGSSYVDAITDKKAVGDATFLVSYSSSYSVEHLIASLESYCNQKHLNTKKTYVWILFLCKNLFRHADKLQKEETVSYKDFRHAFGKRLVFIGKIVSIVGSSDLKLDYLHRLWCLVETYAAGCTNGIEFDIVIPPSLNDNIFQTLDFCDEVLKHVNFSKSVIEATRTTDPQDHQHLMDLINHTVGMHPFVKKITSLLQHRVSRFALDRVKAYEHGHKNLNSDVTYAKICQRVGDILVKSNSKEQALYYYERSSSVEERVYGKEHKDLYNIQISIASVLNSIGRHDTALKTYEKILTWAKSHANGKNVEAASTHCDIGKVHQIIHQYDDALRNYIAALEIQSELYGEEHVDIAESISFVGLTLFDRGDFEGAIENLQNAVQMQTNLFGEENATLAKYYNSLAMVYVESGDTEKAVENHKKALEIRKKVLGENNHDVALSYNNVGLAMHSMGDLRDGLQMLKKALSIYKSINGIEDETTAVCCSNIGLIKKDLGEYKAALKFFQRALVILRKIYGESNPEVAACYDNIGMVLYHEREFQTAIQLLHKGLATRVVSLGEDNIFTAHSFSNISHVQYALGDFPVAHSMQNRALEIEVKVLGPSHPDLVISYNNLGRILFAMEDYEGALEVYRKSYLIAKSAFGPSHEFTKLTKATMIDLEKQAQKIEKVTI